MELGATGSTERLRLAGTLSLVSGDTPATGDEAALGKVGTGCSEGTAGTAAVVDAVAVSGAAAAGSAEAVAELAAAAPRTAPCARPAATPAAAATAPPTATPIVELSPTASIARDLH